MTAVNKDPQNTLLIEFFGLPGSGKTLFQSVLMEKFQAHSITTATKKDLTEWIHNRGKYKLALFLLSDFIWALTLFLTLLSKAGIKNLRNRVTWRYICSTITIPLYIKNYIALKKPDLLLLDQAMAQNIWAIWYGYEKPDTESLSKIFKLVNKVLDINYIYFDISVDTSVNRIIERKYNNSRFDGINDFNKVKRMISNGSDFMNSVYDVVDIMNYPIFTIPADQHFEDNSEKVRKWIMGIQEQSYSVAEPSPASETTEAAADYQTVSGG